MTFYFNDKMHPAFATFLKLFLINYSFETITKDVKNE
jgi:hypothetical protein